MGSHPNYGGSTATTPTAGILSPMWDWHSTSPNVVARITIVHRACARMVIIGSGRSCGLARHARRGKGEAFAQGTGKPAWLSERFAPTAGQSRLQPPCLGQERSYNLRSAPQAASSSEVQLGQRVALGGNTGLAAGAGRVVLTMPNAPCIAKALTVDKERARLPRPGRNPSCCG